MRVINFENFIKFSQKSLLLRPIVLTTVVLSLIIEMVLDESIINVVIDPRELSR